MRRFVPLLLCLFAFAASAQVVQPTYIRPSKGAMVTAITTTGTVPSVSSVFDTTAFDSLYVAIELVTGGPGTISWEVQGAFSTAGPFSIDRIDDPMRNATSSVLDAGDFYTFRIGGLSSFAKFRITSAPAGSTFNLKFIPLPLSYTNMVSGITLDSTVPIDPQKTLKPVLIGGVGDTNNQALAAKVKASNRAIYTYSTGNDPVSAIAAYSTTVNNTATLVRAAASTVCKSVLVNTDTTTAYCSTTNTITAASGIPLNAAASSGVAGGNFSFDNYDGAIYCITSAGSTVIRTQTYNCE